MLYINNPFLLKKNQNVFLIANKTHMVSMSARVKRINVSAVILHFSKCNRSNNIFYRIQL